MLQKAGTGIAMRNSDKSLFEAADMITACDNNDAGVGKTIMELIG
jgi:hydroxymethylpyrimidine pyrophosphatase-like HAD family hydrolase